MTIRFSILILMILLLKSNAEGKNRSDSVLYVPRIDSIFTKHLNSIENCVVADTGKYCINNSEDNDFLNMIGFFTDRKYKFQNFTMLIMLDRSELEKIKKWYKENRTRLNYEKIKRFLYIWRRWNNIATTFDSNKQTINEYFDEILSELDSIKKINTFIE